MLYRTGAQRKGRRANTPPPPPSPSIKDQMPQRGKEKNRQAEAVEKDFAVVVCAGCVRRSLAAVSVCVHRQSCCRPLPCPLLPPSLSPFSSYSSLSVSFSFYRIFLYSSLLSIYSFLLFFFFFHPVLFIYSSLFLFFFLF